MQATELREDAVLDAQPESTADFAEIYREFSRPLYGTALRILRRPEEAEEAVQEAFLAFYRRADELDPARLGGWLHRVLVNECLDRVRRRTRWRTTGVDENLAVAPPLADGAAIDLEKAVARLPERARLVFLLHDVEGFKHREVTAMLDLAEGTTKSQLFRARRMLREVMSRPPRGAR